MRRTFIVAITALSVAVGTTGLSSLVTSTVASAATSTTPIVVGGDGDLGLAQGTAQGFEAGIYRFNKAGGLDGRKIKFTGFLDDGYSAQNNLTNAQQLVQNDHVMAVLPFLSGVATGSTGTFLKENKTPFIGWAINEAFGTEPKWGFGINGNQNNPQIQGLGGMEQLLTATGNTKTPSKVKLAFIAENLPGGITSNGALAGVAKYVGMKVVYEQAPIAIIGTTSYAPYAQAVMASGANAVYEVLDASDATGLAAALKSAGFKGSVVNGVTYFPGQLASQPNEAAALNGVLVEDEYPANENNTPAVKQAEKDLASVGAPPYLTSGAAIGYWSAIIFEQMLKATLQKVGGNPDKVTGATLQATVNSGFTYTDPIAGGIGTETFPAAESVPTGCGTLVKTTGTTFKQVTPYQCLGAVNVVTKKKISEKTGEPLS